MKLLGQLIKNLINPQLNVINADPAGHIGQIGAGGVWQPVISTGYPWTITSGKLVDNYSNNVQINGDTAWQIITALSLAEAQTYLDDCAVKQFNGIIIELPAIYFGPNVPFNDAGDPPFNSTVGGEYDFTDPNANYWAHADAVINYANTKDITVFIWPAYIGINLGAEGWASALTANGTTRMSTYGTWIGNRYKDYNNIVWVGGGDNPPSTIINEHNAMMNAIKAADPNHLMTAHSIRNSSAYDDYNEAWLDFNSSYTTDVNVASTVETDLLDGLPTFLIEAYYGGSGFSTAQEVMMQAYQGLLSGGFGHFMGIDPMWYFPTGWASDLDLYGRQYATYIADLQAARDLPSLTPDSSDTFVTNAKGSGLTQACFLADSSQLVGICPTGFNPTVDFSQFSGSVNVRWYNPTTGATQTDSLSPHSNSGSSSVTTPDAGDWVLLIDLESLNLGAP